MGFSFFVTGQTFLWNEQRQRDWSQNKNKDCSSRNHLKSHLSCIRHKEQCRLYRSIFSTGGGGESLWGRNYKQKWVSLFLWPSINPVFLKISLRETKELPFFVSMRKSASHRGLCFEELLRTSALRERQFLSNQSSEELKK